LLLRLCSESVRALFVQAAPRLCLPASRGCNDPPNRAVGEPPRLLWLLRPRLLLQNLSGSRFARLLSLRRLRPLLPNQPDLPTSQTPLRRHPPNTPDRGCRRSVPQTPLLRRRPLRQHSCWCARALLGATLPRPHPLLPPYGERRLYPATLRPHHPPLLPCQPLPSSRLSLPRRRQWRERSP